MGCGDTVYSQIKQKCPQEFQQYLTMNELSKQIENRTNGIQKKTSSAINDLKTNNMTTVDTKRGEMISHFESLKKDVDKSYPGGLSFLQSSKQATFKQLMGVSKINTQYMQFKTGLKNQFAQEETKVSQEIDNIKNQELQSTKSQTPNIAMLENITPDLKDSIIKMGLGDYKKQIEDKKAEYLSGFDKKIDGQGLVNRFKNFLPMDKLNNLTAISKQSISKKAANLIGKPGENKASLF